MPVYEYYCEHCENIFTQLRSICDYNKSSNCPICDLSSERILFSAPRLNTMNGNTRKAYQLNEKSSHEPSVRTRHTCNSSCNHDHSTKPQNIKQQNGKRPWMLGH